MADSEVIAGEIVDDEATAIVRVSTTLFRTDEPAAVVERATATAEALAPVISAQKLFTSISGKRHVRVEGWTLLGTMLGVFPIIVWTKPIPDDWTPADGQVYGFEARCEARTRAGELVGAADARCTRGESLWKTRDDYAIQSMAQTRSISKCLRVPLGFVMQLAGYEAAPAEEMDSTAGETPVTQPEAKKASQAKMKKIHALGNDLGWDHDELRRQLGLEAKNRSMTTLTDDEAAKCIDWLEGRLDAERVADAVQSDPSPEGAEAG
jgi:hypothetical protein